MLPIDIFLNRCNACLENSPGVSAATLNLLSNLIDSVNDTFYLLQCAVLEDYALRDKGKLS